MTILDFIMSPFGAWVLALPFCAIVALLPSKED